MSDWKEIKTAPKGKRILFFVNDKDGSYMIVGKIEVMRAIYENELTHWQELPKPPEQI